MRTLIVAEHDHQHLKSGTLSTLTAAMALKSPIDLIVIGQHCHSVVQEARSLAGVQCVIVADHEVYQSLLAENLAKLLASFAQDYTHILCPASTFGKDLLPRLAGLLECSLASDIIEIIDQDTFIRPIYAGNALATVRLKENTRLLTVRSSAFAKYTLQAETLVELRACDRVYAAEKTSLIRREESQNDRPELANAKVVVSGGRGLQNKENFALIEALADKLGAAVGASRAAVDAGFVPNDYQVGQTGKVVAPNLYIGIGISGAIQHLAGMKDSRVIVAINKDPEAPIFQIADYGLVGDLFKIIPELLSKL